MRACMYALKGQKLPVIKDLQNRVLVAGVSVSADSGLSDLTPLEDT